MENINSIFDIDAQQFNFEPFENENDLFKQNCLLSFFNNEQGEKLMTLKGKSDFNLKSKKFCL